ncbi:LicD family protein [bacterium]|nr:LicD family protein [bacterium]
MNKFFKLIEKIFSIKYEYNDFFIGYKIITILGIKIKLKHTNYKKNLEKRLNELDTELKLLKSVFRNSIDITKIPPTRGNLRSVQLIKTRLLEITDYLLQKNNIQYWLEFGTLIGAIRHQGFIPWDDDIDISVLWDDYLKLPKLFEDLISKDSRFWILYGWQGSEIIRFGYDEFCIDFFPYSYTDKRYETLEEKIAFEEKWHTITKSFIEEFSFDKFKSNEICHLDKKVLEAVNKYKNQIFGNNFAENKNSNQLIVSAEAICLTIIPRVIECESIFPLKTSTFEGLNVFIPNNPIEHLYECRCYGEKGAVMNFPSFKDQGFAHTQTIYNKNSDYYINVLEGLTQVVTKIKTDVGYEK